MLIWWTKKTGDKTRMSVTFCSQQLIPIESHWSVPGRISSYWFVPGPISSHWPELHSIGSYQFAGLSHWIVLIRTTYRISSCQPVLICIGSSSLFLVLLGSPSFAIWTVLILVGSLFNKFSISGAFLFSMIRTHIHIAHIASIRTGSPVDSRQCDWCIIHVIGTHTSNNAGLKKWWFNYSEYSDTEMYPSFYKDCFFYGC